ncbi:MAG: DUF4145 domain-containing protein [Acidobacteria bacterium]|nr:DUF4145 domain-containing protein [Acidobacteriota bacterium]
MSLPEGDWPHKQNVQRKKYTCGYSDCSREVGSDKGWEFHQSSNSQRIAHIYICPVCCRPTFFDSVNQIPGTQLGTNIEHLPKEISQLYSEVRKSTSQGAYTAAVLSCRKLLMHIAVEQGAQSNGSFVDYVDYLVDNHFAPPKSQPWVDRIRQKGNEANHEIKIMVKSDAQEIMTFLEMLLKFIYEFPQKAQSAVLPPGQ